MMVGRISKLLVEVLSKTAVAVMCRGSLTGLYRWRHGSGRGFTHSAL